MPACLRLVLAIFCMTFVCAAVKTETFRKGIRDYSLNGKVSNQHLLFHANVTSKLACASTCLEYNCCVAFSTSPEDPPSKKVTCRGHDSRSILQSSTVHMPGSKTYIMESKPPEPSSWLERSCWQTSPCPANVANVVCYPDADQCLCEPGYYYSYCRDACVRECPEQDLLQTFLKYPKHYIKDLNIPGSDVTDCGTEEKARKACLLIPQCRTFDFNDVASVCFLQAVTALDYPAYFLSYPVNDHYQRTCL